MLSGGDICSEELESQVLAKKIRDQIPEGKQVAFVSGSFNIVHTGLFRVLNFAAEVSDFLIVGIYNDTHPGALIPQHLRLEGVQSIECVNLAVSLPCSAEEFITWLKPDLVIKGQEHEQHFNPEQSVLETYGGKLLFSSGEMRLSSLDLLRHELQHVVATTIQQPIEYIQRHNINNRKLSHLVKSFSDLSVVVIGDLILDEYLTCDPLGISREDPTIVVTPIKQDLFVGGAGVVAAHARGLGAKVHYFGIVGEDEVAKFAAETLKEQGVSCYMHSDSSRPTTLKQRYRAEGKTLLRVSHLRHHNINIELADKILSELSTVLETADLVIFSDFNYGCLSQYLVDNIIALCNERSIPMVADSQSSSQIGDISRFHGMLLITPTEHEARLGVREQTAGLNVLADCLREKARATHVFITLGAEGLFIYSPDYAASGIAIDQLPAFNPAPKDVAGGGDCLLVCASLALVAGANIWESAYLGSLAAAHHVGRIGNSPISFVDLLRELHS